MFVRVRQELDARSSVRFLLLLAIFSPSPCAPLPVGFGDSRNYRQPSALGSMPPSHRQPERQYGASGFFLVHLAVSGFAAPNSGLEFPKSALSFIAICPESSPLTGMAYGSWR
jgi:hypothetical protein